MVTMMMRLVAVLLAMVVIMAALGRGLPDDQSPEAVEKWFKRFPKAKPKLTKLHFYVHNTVSENPPASAPVAEASFTATSPTSFGQVNVLDGPLTEKPDSKIMGYAQGLFTFSSLEERSSLMTLDFVFTDGKYNGSTLSVLGRNPVAQKYREFPIVGGSGDFRLANGIGTVSTFYVNTTTRDNILEIHVICYRYTLAKHFASI